MTAKTTKSAITAEHGTKYAYNQGCRCAACRRANTAHKWAETHVGRWNGSIADALHSGVVFVDRDTTITAELLFEVLKHYEQRIKIEALRRLKMKESLA